MAVVTEVSGNEGVADPAQDIGTEDAEIVARWVMELQAARKGPYARWLKRSKQAIKRYRDEDMDSEGGTPGRNAQFNVLWSNMATVAPSIYSRAPKPIAERRYLDKDQLARAAATILQRSLAYQVEESGLHETMLQCRTDFYLVGIGDAWVRYQAEYEPAAPQQQGAETAPPDDERQREDIKYQKVCVDYNHWSDGLVSPARFWSEITWRAKRAYYRRSQLKRTFGSKGDGQGLTDEEINQIPLKTTRGKKQNDAAEQQRSVIGHAEVWQIWDLEQRKVIWICEDWPTKPLKQSDDLLNLADFWPSARPVRATTTNDSFWPIPDYSIWHDQAAELDNLTARIAALTRAIKAVGVFDNSFPELAQMLGDGMENKLLGIKNWAKLAQKGGLDGAVQLLPMADLAATLTGLYQARAQVKQDLYEISGVSDIVRGASDPNETAAAQKMKGAFSQVRGGDRKNEFNRFVRDTLLIMAEIMLEQFTDEQLWLMSDFEQWAAEQDLRSYAPPQPPAPMMGHNGGPPLDDAAQPMPQMPPSAAVPAPGLPGGGPVMDPSMPPQTSPALDQMPGAAPGLPGAQQPPGGPAPMASAPGIPPIPGLPMGANAQPPMPAPAAPIPPSIPPGPQPVPARVLFEEALALLREDRLRSFRIQVETNSTIEPDQQEEKAARVEFLGAVTNFLAQAQDMAAAYPQIMPVLGKMLLFGARGFQVGRELESSLEGLIADLEQMARNPKPKPPSPEEIKAQAIKDKAASDQQKAQMDLQADQARMQMEMQKLKMELEAQRQKLEMERQKLEMQIQMQAQKAQLDVQIAQQKAQTDMMLGEQKLALGQREGEMKVRQQDQQMQLDQQRGALEAEGMDREAEHQARTLDRREQHETRRYELAEEAAEAKAGGEREDD